MSPYTVYVAPRALGEIRSLPGHVRQRVRRAVDALSAEPRPPKSKRLDAPEIEFDLYRVRLDRWRIVYGVSDDDRTVDVLAVRRRPPYDYGDLEALIAAFM